MSNVTRTSQRHIIPLEQRLTSGPPRMELGQFPTPVRRMDRLGVEWGHDQLWIKRDDLTSGLYGGNKVRKLEYLLPDIARRSEKDILVFGGTGSNQVVALAMYAPLAGLRVHALLFDQPRTEKVEANFAAILRSGVGLTRLRHSYALPVSGVFHLIFSRIRHGHAPLVFPAGGSSPLGTLGYVNAALELEAQVRSGEIPEPAAIFVAMGSQGTAAGLALGLRMTALATRLIPVRVVDRLVSNEATLARLIHRTRSLLYQSGDCVLDGSRWSWMPPAIEHGFFGPGYGAPTSEALRAIADVSRLEGIALEPTYTGKALAAMRAYASRPEWRGLPLLFWNTVNSVDLGRLARLPSLAAIPAEFRDYFSGSHSDA